MCQFPERPGLLYFPSRFRVRADMDQAAVLKTQTTRRRAVKL